MEPTPVFLPGESQGWGAWWAAVCGVAQSRTRLKQLSSSSSSRVALQCCLISAVQQCGSALCIHIPPPLWASLPLTPIPPCWVITEHWAQLPVVYSSFPQAICFIQGSVYMSMWLCQFILTSPSSPSHPCVHKSIESHFNLLFITPLWGHGPPGNLMSSKLLQWTWKCFHSFSMGFVGVGKGKPLGAKKKQGHFCSGVLGYGVQLFSFPWNIDKEECSTVISGSYLITTGEPNSWVKQVLSMSEEGNGET